MKAFDILSESQTFVVEQHFQKTNLLVESVCVGLTKNQRKIVEGIYKEFRPLIEASLTVDQIQKIFTDVEKGATTAGGNRTLIGQGKDVAAKANEIINKAGRWIQNTTPVQGFDQKFENLKTQVSQKFPDLANKLSQMGEWAKANPGKTAAVIGILTALASLAGGPLGGAIAGQILRGTAELLKGEKLSTAIGHGLKAAALGYLAGKSFELIGQAVSKGADLVKDTMYPELYHLKLMKNSTAIGFNHIDVIGRPEDLKPLSDAWDQAGELLNQGDVAGAAKLIVQIKDQAEAFQTPQYFAKLVADADARDAFANSTKTAVNVIDGIGAAMQGAAAGYTGFDKSGNPVKGKTAESKQLTADQISVMFEQCSTQSQLLAEGPLDALKGMAAKGIGAVANKAKTIGHNLTTKITADKLNSAWKKAGSPTDSNAVAQVLRKAGVSDEVLGPVYKSLNLNLPKSVVQRTAATNMPRPGTQQPSATSGTQSAAQPATLNVTGNNEVPGNLDYKSLQAAVAQLRTRDAQSLLTYIDSIENPTAQKPAATKPTATASQSLNPTLKTKEPKLAGEEPTTKPVAKPAQAARADNYPVSPTDKFNPNTGEPIKQNPAQATNQNAFSGDKFDGDTGEMTPAYKADLEKRLKAQQKNPAATATTAKPASTTAPASTPNADNKVGQSAITANNTTNSDMDAAEKAALDRMKAKNPNLARLMSVEKGLGQNTTKKPIKITKTRTNVKQPAVQTASKENYGNRLAESLETRIKELTSKLPN